LRAELERREDRRDARRTEQLDRKNLCGVRVRHRAEQEMRAIDTEPQTLWAACELGDLPLAAALIQHAAAPSSATKKGKKPKPMTKKQLKQRYVYVNALSARGYSALHIACVNGFRAIVELLVASGAEVFLRSTSDSCRDDTAIHFAVKGGFTDVLEVLLSTWLAHRMSSVSAASDKKTQQLKDEKTHQEQRKMRMELEARFANCPGWQRSAPLETAVFWRRERTVAWLLAHRADPNVVGSSRAHTPLHTASRRGAILITKLLLEARADPTLRNSANESPLLMCYHPYPNATLLRLYGDYGYCLRNQECSRLLDLVRTFFRRQQPVEHIRRCLERSHGSTSATLRSMLSKIDNIAKIESVKAPKPTRRHVVAHTAAQRRAMQQKRELVLKQRAAQTAAAAAAERKQAAK
jgi:ankyrin repeat protein